MISATNHFSLWPVLLLLGSMTGCGALEQASYYSVVPTDANIKTAKWGDGIALVSKSVCIWIAEGDTKDYRLLSIGPIGLPIIPVQILPRSKQESAFFKLELWFVPDAGQDGILFDPKLTRVRFDNGTEITPVTIQVSRFKTRMIKEPGFFTPITKERIATPDHWENKLTKEFLEPVSLWDWSRFKMTFEKSAKERVPVSLVIPGMVRHGKVLDAIELRLKNDRDTRYLYPGKDADNTPIGGSPADACHALFESAKQKL